jgi:threonine aldolase
MNQFTSDNRSGAVPEVIAALLEANAGHAASYGDDPWTQRAADLMRQTFETDCDVYFVATGTAANSLALATLCQSYHSVICSRVAHIETDECGAPEFFSNGTKLLLADGDAGKIDPAAVTDIVRRRTDIHYPRPRVLSLTQATELGTVYSPDEVARLASTAKSLGLHVHMDGARFANAVAACGCSPADLTWRAGVEVLCFGGTKNGMLGGEAVIFFDRELSREFAYRCKQGGQLISKMRFVAAQWIGLLTDGVWQRYAGHANAMARRLSSKLAELGISPILPVQANSVFVTLAPEALAGLAAKGWHVYTFIGNAARLMCSWDTTPEDVDRLAADLATVIRGR